ncbi:MULTISPECIES: hypothetical protein [Bacillus cereus group]|uniref:hypothetical protein n=1 Tax=Bacillus cereus group TaxID=86661 RepID=UPI0005CF28CB|nr:MULTISPECIES: hypothetical protein [Bacillus cereus group]
MNIITVTLSMFIFSIITILISTLWCWKTKEINSNDIQRLKGGIICLVASSIILIFRNTFEPVFNNVALKVSQQIGLSISEVTIYLLGFVIFIAFFRAIRR